MMKMYFDVPVPRPNIEKVPFDAYYGIVAAVGERRFIAITSSIRDAEEIRSLAPRRAIINLKTGEVS